MCDGVSNRYALEEHGVQKVPNFDRSIERGGDKLERVLRIDEHASDGSSMCFIDAFLRP